MRQVQNGHMYIMYNYIGAAFREMKHCSGKCLQTTSFNYSNAKSTILVPVTFNTFEKTKHENFNFVHLVCFSMSGITQSANVVTEFYMYQTTALEDVAFLLVLSHV